MTQAPKLGLSGTQFMKGLFEIPEDWQWMEFGEIAHVASKLVDPKAYPNSPHVAPNHIEPGTGRLLPYSTISEDGVASVKHEFKAGQILYSKIRPYLAKVVLVDFAGLCSADMYPIESSLDPSYLRHWMLSTEFTLAASQNQGRNLLPKINTKELSSLPVPVPPVPEQQRIARVLDSVDALRAKRRETIALLADFAQSIFFDMFGDPALNPRGWERKRFGSLLEVPLRNGVHSGVRLSWAVASALILVAVGDRCRRVGLDLGCLIVDHLGCVRVRAAVALV